MTSYAQFSEALGALSSIEAFEAAAAIENVAGRFSVAGIIAGLLLNAAANGSDDGQFDQSRVDHAVDIVTKSTVLEVAEFSALLRDSPRYRAN